MKMVNYYMAISIVGLGLSWSAHAQIASELDAAKDELVAWSEFCSNLSVRARSVQEWVEPVFSGDAESSRPWLMGDIQNRNVRVEAETDSLIQAWGQGLRVEFLGLNRKSWTAAGLESFVSHGKLVPDTAYYVLIDSPSRGEAVIFGKDKKFINGGIFETTHWSDVRTGFGWYADLPLGLSRLYDEDRSHLATSFWQRQPIDVLREDRIAVELREAHVRHVWTFATDPPFRLVEYCTYFKNPSGGEMDDFKMKITEFVDTGRISVPRKAEAVWYAWDSSLQESVVATTLRFEYQDYKPLPVREDEEAVWYEWPKGAEVRDARVGETIRVMRDGEKLTDAVIAQYLAEQIGPREKAVDELLESLEPAAN